MSFEFQNSYFDVELDPGFTRALQRSQLTRVGENETDLFSQGYAEYWLDRPPRPGQFFDLVTGIRFLNGERVEQVDSWQEWNESEKRDALESQIQGQVPDYSSTQTLVDRLKQNDVQRYSAAATDRKIDLDGTPSEDLNTFDPNLEVKPPQEPGLVYSSLTLAIVYLEPWVGAPDNNIGFECVLEVEPKLEDEGAEARLHVIDGPDAGAILPFAQSSQNTRVWTVTSRDGFKWSDPNTAVTVRLLWGDGSRPVSPDMRLEQLHDRVTGYVRYGESIRALQIRKWKK